MAEVAAIALTEDRLAYGTFELCSSGILNRHEVAALISEVIGKQVTVGTIGPEVLGQFPNDMKTMCRHYDHRGLVGNPLVLRAILGREPRTLRAYFEELANTHAA